MPAQQWEKKSCAAGRRGFSLCLQKQLPDATGEKQTMQPERRQLYTCFKVDVFHHLIYHIPLQELLFFLILGTHGIYPCWLRTYVGCSLWTGRLYLYWMLCSESRNPLCGGQRQWNGYKNITVLHAVETSFLKLSDSFCCRIQVYTTVNAEEQVKCECDAVDTHMFRG